MPKPPSPRFSLSPKVSQAPRSLGGRAKQYLDSDAKQYLDRVKVAKQYLDSDAKQYLNSDAKQYLNRVSLVLGFLILLLVGCRDDSYFSGKNSLQYSSDTVWFDTVFTRKPGSSYPISVTKIVSIKNPEKLPVMASFGLAGGSASPYRVSVDGKTGIDIRDIEIGAEDSVFVFVQCKLEANNQNYPLLVVDSLIAKVNGSEQKTILAAYGWDAHYFHDTIFNANTTFGDADKPYVIVGYMGVESGASLSVKAGVQIFASAQSSLYVAGTLDIQGSAAKRVSIRGNKPAWETQFMPNQWRGIHFLVGSSNNRIQYADIGNAVIGIRVDSLSVNLAPGLQLLNTRIQYCGQACLLGVTASIEAENCLFADAGTYSFLGLLGGQYRFNHCTFADYSGFSPRSSGHFALSNTLRDAYGKLLDHAALNCSLYNSIVYGYNKEELQFNQSTLSAFVLHIENNVLKTENPDGLLVFPNFQNKNPNFIDTKRGHYALDTLSSAYKKAGVFGNAVITDILGKPRKPLADIGCYERTP